MRKTLKSKRQEKKLKVDETALMLNISTSHYYKIESGLRNPNFILAGKIAKLFDSNVDEIFFDNNLDDSSNKKLA